MILMGMSKAFRTDPIRALGSGITNRESGLRLVDILHLLVDGSYHTIHPVQNE